MRAALCRTVAPWRGMGGGDASWAPEERPEEGGAGAVAAAEGRRQPAQARLGKEEGLAKKKGCLAGLVGGGRALIPLDFKCLLL